jgi:hypothetical protein
LAEDSELAKALADVADIAEEEGEGSPGGAQEPQPEPEPASAVEMGKSSADEALASKTVAGVTLTFTKEEPPAQATPGAAMGAADGGVRADDV